MGCTPQNEGPEQRAGVLRNAGTFKTISFQITYQLNHTHNDDSHGQSRIKGIFNNADGGCPVTVLCNIGAAKGRITFIIANVLVACARIMGVKTAIGCHQATGEA